MNVSRPQSAQEKCACGVGCRGMLCIALFMCWLPWLEVGFDLGYWFVAGGGTKNGTLH
nr:hypothetical protein [uncultured Desulfobulbus sp.]